MNGRTTAARTQDRGPMHPGHCQSTYPKSRGDRKAIQDQDLNYPHGATFTLHR
jgi:hypothetical protein